MPIKTKACAKAYASSRGGAGPGAGGQGRLCFSDDYWFSQPWLPSFPEYPSAPGRRNLLSKALDWATWSSLGFCKELS